MLFRKLFTLTLTIIFIFGCTVALPQFSAAAPPWGHPVFGHGKDRVTAAGVDEDVWKGPDEDGGEEDSQDIGERELENIEEEAEEQEEIDQGPAWARGEHPSLKGLYNAYQHLCCNGASLRAQERVLALIRARTVEEAVYALEEAVGDDETLEEVTSDEETCEALLEEANRLQEEVQQQFRESKKKAWALKKLGRVYARLGDRLAAEDALIQAAALTPEDKAVYEEINKLYAGIEMSEMPVFIKGKKVVFDVPPQVKNGRTLVPLRKFAESLGCTVDWDPVRKQVVVMQGAKKVVLGIGEKIATVNGRKVALDVPAQILNGRTLVPLRFVAESLDAQVDYYDESSMIVVK
ncbi:MAG: Copper amine oxidase-like domain-containing protein [Clostridia bacterium 62_21]|nr:MAG: Copper amine oxidase-like domain-containing protein [Clostridia bacterium 62_21]